MKVCLLNTFDQTGGAARASVRLLQGLTALGINAQLLVREKVMAEPTVRATGSLRGGRLRALLDYLPLKSYPHKQPDNFSRARTASPVVGAVSKAAPDIVHLHWVTHGFLNVEALPGLSPPIVWTLHDAWPFTGGCHLPGECQRYQQACGCCPVLGSARDVDLSRHVWKRKHRNYPVKRMTFVAPSQWMAARAKASSLLHGCAVRVIPNGLDVSCYVPGDKASTRLTLGLPQERKLILCGAKNLLSDPNKGADLLWQTLGKLPAEQRRSCTLVLFGESPERVIPPFDMQVVNCGVVVDEGRIIDLYRAADLFVMTSRQENLPNTIAEAMACGLPCAAFGVGGIPEQVTHRLNGCLAPPFDTATLANELEWLLADGDRLTLLAGRARLHAVQHYALEAVARQHCDLYLELLRRRAN